MTDKEKKAMEYLKRHIIPVYGSKGQIEYLLNDTILNLIEKQQKELEQEKEKNKGLEIRANELNGLAEIVERDYIHKAKIKAKIEELLKE